MTRTGDLVYEEELDGAYTTGAWQAAGGCMQSLTFYFNALRIVDELFSKLREWKGEIVGSRVENLECTPLVLHDYGCAMGDGTALLQAAFPFAWVKGFDKSEAGVEAARARWPEVAFEVGDVLDPEPAHIIWTSHTIEHTEKPHEVIERLRTKCSWLVVVVPFIKHEGDGGHDGAMLTAEWAALLDPPYMTTSYYTPRHLPSSFHETSGKCMIENNFLCVWQGSLGAHKPEDENVLTPTTSESSGLFDPLDSQAPTTA